MPCRNGRSTCSRRTRSAVRAITSKSKDKAETELSPALKAKGTATSADRHHAAALQPGHLHRPCIAFKGNPLNFIRRKTDGGSRSRR